MARALLVLFLFACARASAPTMPDTSFTRYIALGDSISIDIYPANDVARRYPGRAARTGSGPFRCS